MVIWLIVLMLILLTRVSQRGSLVGGGGKRADHVPRGCSRLISLSRDGAGICLGDKQTTAPGVPAESGCSDMLLQLMLPYLT